MRVSAVGYGMGNKDFEAANCVRAMLGDTGTSGDTVAELSLNVGIFNLLPLPVLDGGQVVLLLGEAVAGRKLNEKVKMGLMGACWILLITVMVYATWNDIIRLFG